MNPSILVRQITTHFEVIKKPLLGVHNFPACAANDAYLPQFVSELRHFPRVTVCPMHACVPRFLLLWYCASTCWFAELCSMFRLVCIVHHCVGSVTFRFVSILKHCCFAPCSFLCAQDALPVLWNIYIEILPQLTGKDVMRALPVRGVRRDIGDWRSPGVCLCFMCIAR